MTAYAEIVVVAFVAQLAVLPGEKVQFMIAALSTRYDPKVVVAAAGSAFAGWTAIEIAFGQALQSALPGVVLDAVTAVLFFVFAYLLYRSMPNRESDRSPRTVTATRRRSIRTRSPATRPSPRWSR